MSESSEIVVFGKKVDFRPEKDDFGCAYVEDNQGNVYEVYGSKTIQGEGYDVYLLVQVRSEITQCFLQFVRILEKDEIS